MNTIKSGLLLLFALVCFNSCNKETDLFSGSDNFLSTFQLKQGSLTLSATISTDSILITAPENLSLQGATVLFSISENARIEPDPATVTDWDAKQTFTITSFNGAKKIYAYDVKRNVIAKKGDIILLNQADVETLAALQLSQIDGSLTIGASTGADSIFSLAPLAGLKVIKQGLTINATFAGENLSGLENLEKVGALLINQNKKLKSISFPQLNSLISGLTITQSQVESLDFPELTTIDRGFQITTSDSITLLSFPKLKRIVESMSITGGWSVNNLRTIDFPSLEKVGGDISISNWKEVTTVNMPLLTNATVISITGLPKMISLTMPALNSTLGNVTISANSLLETMNLSALHTIRGNCRIENNPLIENLDGCGSLTEITGELFIGTMTSLKDIQGLKGLKTVGGRLYLSGWPALEDSSLSGLSNLESVGGDLILSQIPFKRFTGFSLSKVNNLGIYGNGLSSIEEIDIRTLQVENTLTLSNISTSLTIKGATLFSGNMSIDQCNITAMEGFEEVKNLTYSMNQTTAALRALNVKKVNGNLSLSLYNFATFRMPLLEEVVGTFNLSTSAGIQQVELPALKKTGAATLGVAILQSFTLPALESVDGNLTITIGAYNANNLETLQMPLLKTVNGILTLGGYSSYYPNTKLTHLNGFSALGNVKGVTISYSTGLIDYTGLKNSISSFAADQWKVTANGYNPTYENMVDGQYVKP